MQPSAWTPGAFELQQGDAGLTPYNSATGIMHRDRNVELKCAGSLGVVRVFRVMMRHPLPLAVVTLALCTPSAIPGCRWEWLEPVLDQVAALRGNMTAYRALVAADRVKLRVGFPPE